jgi:prepilin-type processing-associated H-X9-DG protein
VAIIALLISILLPSLSNARAQAKAVKCAANMNAAGKAVAAYLSEERGTYPMAYWYPGDYQGTLSISNQSPTIAYGYAHWSWALYQRGQVADGSFECPEMLDRGHPRTNPGPDGSNWSTNGDQVDTQGSGTPPPKSAIEDKQAKRMAYTANAAIMPRNKMGNIPPPDGADQKRRNRFVRDNEIEEPGRTVLITEFNRNWKAISEDKGDGFLSKSHRPVNPFSVNGQSSNEYSCPIDLSGYFYHWGKNDKNYGLRDLSQIEEAVGKAEANWNELNFVGRHHPGGDKLGGTANFLYCDGHVKRTTVLSTIEDRQWGRAYYAMTGKNRVNIKLGYEFVP